MEHLPFCFVLMPFGNKPDATSGGTIDFDRIYFQAVKPAVEEVGLQPIRADEEKTGGIIHKPMFERLLLCEYAIADLTAANANVFYELGVRHTARPRTTQAIYARHQPIPFDLNFLRALPYELGPQNRFGKQEADALRQALVNRLQQLRELAGEEDAIDSPLFQLLGEWKPDISRLKTDIFREQVRYSEDCKVEMARVRNMNKTEGRKALHKIQSNLSDLNNQEVGVLVDLMLSYRALSDWTGMIELYMAMPGILKKQVMVREQFAFALNRRAGQAERSEDERRQDRERALQILTEVEGEQGSSSETCGLMGRVYKDLWNENRSSAPRMARGYLKKAIEAYGRGFEADWRDAYPGVNAVTLLDIRGNAKSLRERDLLLPVVRYAAEQRLKSTTPDYWDYATLLELAVLASDREAADESLDNALAAVRESWVPETTARNVSLIREARIARGENVEWLEEIIDVLENRSE